MTIQEGGKRAARKAGSGVSRGFASRGTPARPAAPPRPTQARALMFEQRDSGTWTVLDGEQVG
jgi:hypothetical protein